MAVTNDFQKYRVLANTMKNITKTPPNKDTISPTPCINVSFMGKILMDKKKSVTKLYLAGPYFKVKIIKHKLKNLDNTNYLREH